MNTVNVSGAGTEITIDNSKITCNDTTDEVFAALVLNKEATEGKIIASNTVLVVNGNSQLARNNAEGGKIVLQR